jgi:hypothetical protein
VVRMGSSDERGTPVSVADLLTRHGPAPGAGRPVVPAPRGPSTGRLRRTLIAVGSVVAAGSVLGGAVAIGTSGHSTPLNRAPGGLFDQLTQGPATAGEPVQQAADTGSSRSGRESGERAGAATAASAVPAPRAAPAPVGFAAPTTSPAPARSTGPQVAGSTGGTARDTPVPAAAGSSAAPAPAATGGAATTPSGSTADGTAPASSSGGPVTGLLGGVTNAVGGLLGG